MHAAELEALLSESEDPLPSADQTITVANISFGPPLQTLIEQGSNILILADERQIISNLLSNAIKYSPEHESIQIRLGYRDKTVILKVHDQGIGIPEADLKHLFEPFHRAANVGTIPGTGLGLIIIKESIELIMLRSA